MCTALLVIVKHSAYIISHFQQGIIIITTLQEWKLAELTE